MRKGDILKLWVTRTTLGAINFILTEMRKCFPSLLFQLPFIIKKIFQPSK